MGHRKARTTGFFFVFPSQYCCGSMSSALTFQRHCPHAACCNRSGSPCQCSIVAGAALFALCWIAKSLQDEPVATQRECTGGCHACPCVLWCSVRSPASQSPRDVDPYRCSLVNVQSLDRLAGGSGNLQACRGRALMHMQHVNKFPSAVCAVVGKG